jgi:peptidoglycan/LPS O-acetylase OafA/YrhL
MMTLQHLASIALLGIGALIALSNVWLLAQQVRGRRSASITPLVGGIFLLVGGLMFPGGELHALSHRRLVLLGLRSTAVLDDEPDAQLGL